MLSFASGSAIKRITALWGCCIPRNCWQTLTDRPMARSLRITQRSPELKTSNEQNSVTDNVKNARTPFAAASPPDSRGPTDAFSDEGRRSHLTEVNAFSALMGSNIQLGTGSLQSWNP